MHVSIKNLINNGKINDTYFVKVGLEQKEVIIKLHFYQLMMALAMIVFKLFLKIKLKR